MITRWQRYLRDHPRGADVALAVLLFAHSFPGTMLSVLGSAPHDPWWPGVLLAAISCTALLWRRSRPRTTVAVTITCTMAMAALGFVLTVLLLAPAMAAVYALAVRTGRRTTNSIVFTGIALLVATALIAGPVDEPLELKVISPAAWLVLPTALGTTTRLRAEQAKRTREGEARRRVSEERMRIARELHDVVAHHLALANAQAGAVAHLIRTRPDEAQKIVTDLAGTTSSALRELKATVGLLRNANDAEKPLEPAPRLAQLPALAASLQSAGLTVTLTTEGEPQPLSPGVDLTAFRIVQEALTNVTKHAATPSAEVRLVYSPDRLAITVTNDADGASPPPTSDPGGGYGLIGMRERALSVGGRLRAGGRPEGGFEVATELPLRSHTQEEDPAT